MNAGDIWHENPALITGIVGATLSLLVSFGLPFTPEQKKAILELATPLYLLIGAFVVKRKVTPNKQIEDAGLTPEGVKQAAAANRAPGVGA